MKQQPLLPAVTDVAARRSPPPLAKAPAPPPLAQRDSPAQQWWAAVHVPDAQPLPLEAMARRAQDFTSRVSLSPPDELLLELRGSLRLFGGADALKAALLGAFQAPLRLAFAPTPLAAQVFVRCAVTADLRDAAALTGQLAPLPLGALRWPDDVLRRLAAVGVRTIGAALRLPRAGFARRFGTLTLETLDRLVGRRADLHRAYVATERFRRRCDPDVELTDQAAVLERLAPLCAELERFLVARQRGITSLAIELTHRNRTATRQVLRLAAPTRDAAQLLSLLELQFGRTRLPAPVRRCELRSGPLVEQPLDSATLWRPGEQGGGAATAQMPSFLEQLRARLGSEALSGLALASGHRPERLTLTPPPQLPSSARRSRDAPIAVAAHRASATGRPGCSSRRSRSPNSRAGPAATARGCSCWPGPNASRAAGGMASTSSATTTRRVDAAGARLWIFRERIARAPLVPAWVLRLTQRRARLRGAALRQQLHLPARRLACGRAGGAGAGPRLHARSRSPTNVRSRASCARIPRSRRRAAASS